MLIQSVKESVREALSFSISRLPFTTLGEGGGIADPKEEQNRDQADRIDRLP